MPSEVDIRNAIAAIVAANAPDAIVIPRDILNVRENGWVGILENPTTGLVRGWAIAQNGAEPVEERGNGALYDYYFDVWQFFQYQTGDDTSNSEDEASTEREAVLLAFSRPYQLPEPHRTTLDGVKALRFPQGTIGTADIENFRGQVRLARGLIIVRTPLGCE